MTAVSESPMVSIAEPDSRMLPFAVDRPVIGQPPLVLVDDLLAVVSGRLEIGDLVQSLSAVASGFLPVDGALLVLSTEDGDSDRCAAAWGGATDDVAATTAAALGDGGPRILDAVPGHGHGIRSGLTSPVRIGDRVLGAFALFSRRPRAYSAPDLGRVERLARCVALGLDYRRLAKQVREPERRPPAEAARWVDRRAGRVEKLARELESTVHIHVAGESPEWRDALMKAAQVAETDTTVLLTGASGTGKEVVARFIHHASARTRGPFVALNCAALPEHLLESELFGFERGAFTGAQQGKPGRIEMAAGGVLFLDEVTEMSLPAQAKLLRVLQEREFQRLGGTRTLKANIRVIAATNRDLRRAVERGEFREDLFYRLQVFEIALAPLRERRADILPLVEVFLQQIAVSFGRPPAGLTQSAREALLRHDWPGNVRELRNALERAAILCEGGLIDAEHLALPSSRSSSAVTSTNLSRIEEDTITQVLKACRWNKSRAARRLGLSRTQLYIRIRRYGIEEHGEE